MNPQQVRFIESFKSHIPSYEEKISSGFDIEQVMLLDDPPYLFEVDIKPLSSLFLTSNLQFQTLISSIISWNDIAKRYNANPPISMQKEHSKLWFNNTVYTELARILNEIVVTTDRKLQLKMLGSVFDWYYKEIGKKPQKTASISNSLIDASRPNTSTTLRINRGEASYYEIGGLRSVHANYDPPKARLKEFNRRLPNSNDFSVSSTTALSYQKMGGFGGENSRPQTSPFGTGALNEIALLRPRTTAGTNRIEEAFPENNTINIGNLLAKYPVNGLQGQNLALRREVHSSQDQKRNHLNQKASMNSPFYNGFFEESPEERKLEDIWFKQRHKELAEKKENEELIGFMKEWASNKGRVEEELIRKGEGDKFGSEFNEMRYETRKNIVLNEEDADLVLHEYPNIENPEHEYEKLENGTDIKKLRVLNEPVEIKGGEEIFIEKKREVIEITHIPYEKEYEKFMTPDKEKENPIEAYNKPKVFDSIQSNNTASTGLSLEKFNNQSLLQSNEVLKLKKEDKVVLEVDENKEIDVVQIKKSKQIAIKLNKQRPSTEHEKSRKFIKYSLANKDRLIGDICDSPIIKLVKPGKKTSEAFKEERNIKVFDFFGNPFAQKTTSSLQNYEYEIAKQRIKNTRFHYGEYLKDSTNLNSNSNSEPNNRNSLSIYSRPFSHQQVYRNFSNIFKPNLLKDAIRQQQINEIDEVKKRMGKWGISCSAKKLETALVMPLVILGEKYKIAESGSTLIENPFNRIEKKKKAKKNSNLKQ